MENYYQEASGIGGILAKPTRFFPKPGQVISHHNWVVENEALGLLWGVIRYQG
jgi:hypothetical protein